MEPPIAVDEPVPSGPLGESTADRLLAAGLDLLEVHGSYGRVSLRAIAARVGVSPTAVYRHFDDHADLLARLAACCWRRFDDSVFGVGLDLADPAERFLAQGLAYVDFAHSSPGIYKVLFERRFDEQRVGAAEAQASYAKLVEVVGAVLERHDDPRSPERVAALVHTWIHGIATLDRHDVVGYPTAAEMVAELGLALGLAGSGPTGAGPDEAGSDHTSRDGSGPPPER